ncbi:MAG: sex pilus assembly, partial [Sphingobacteriaceae bacterium]
VFASSTCSGRFINPVTDVCWSCIMPINIGDVLHIGKGMIPKKRDTKNPAGIACQCTKANIPMIGIPIGFWEPVRLIDITRTPFCMTNLGGIMLGPQDNKRVSSYIRRYDDRAHSSFYHLHYYNYPLIYWLELLTDFICLEQGSFDVAYMSEFDVTWNDEKLQSLFNPEAALFGNILAQSACIFDCAAATFNLARNELFWCAGCYGNMYPFSGANADHVGGVQNSSLLSMRIINKMHRLGLAHKTTTTENRPNGEICRKSLAPLIIKNQYKLQMTYPKSTTGPISCWPLGLSDMLYGSGKDYPNGGQDWGYLVWRKKNCCAF